MFTCSDVKMAFYFTIINSAAAITLKTINNTKAEFFINTSLIWKWLAILDGDLKITFKLQYGKNFTVAFLMTFLLRNGKTQIPFLAQCKYLSV